MHRNMIRLSHQPAVAVDQRDGKIPRGIEDLRIGGAQHRFAHFLGDGIQAVLQNSDGDWIGHGAMVPDSAPVGKGGRAFPKVARTGDNSLW